MLKTSDCRCGIQHAWCGLNIFLVLLCGCLHLSAQTGPATAPVTDEVQKLAAEQRWQEIVLLLEPMGSRSADLNFYYGTALARLQRWREAENAFQAGLRLAPPAADFTPGGEVVIGTPRHNR